MRSDLWGSRECILFICFPISKSLRFRADGDNFENAPRVDKNRCVFKNIRIRVDGALVTSQTDARANADPLIFRIESHTERDQFIL